MTGKRGSVAPPSAVCLRGAWVAIAVVLAAYAGAISSAAGASCPAERSRPLMPQDSALCASLAVEIRDPSALPLDRYEEKLSRFLGAYCHRDGASGWLRDKRVRDTGPFTARFSDGVWTGKEDGTHSPVVIWYSPEMVEWLRANRPAAGGGPAEPAPVPDGAVMVKEMFPAPASLCAEVAPERLFPTNGAAIMVRDRGASHDGWFWGWYGFGPDSGWSVDWPPAESSPPANMGFGQYCVNCHASAADNQTFAAARNVAGEAGTPLVFLDQSGTIAGSPAASYHREVVLPQGAAFRLGEPHYRPDAAVLAGLRAEGLALETWDSVARMPSQSYDNSWVAANGPTAADEFLTSSQCLGCHDAGSTGLQFDMTMPNPHGAGLINMSPYATWRNSPMGLAGRDPFFMAQLASETETFHPESSALIQDTCLGCHGINGQRQYHIDRFAETGKCESFSRQMLDAVPWPAGNPGAGHAKYAALGRDGISCTSCHRMSFDYGDAPLARPENACVEARQDFLNKGNTGFARTFTGSFPVRAPDAVAGPFENPKPKSMQNALGITPEHDAGMRSSEVCGTCHTIRLPVLDAGKVVAHEYEQITYAEWAFSAFRMGETTAGKLPHGKGEAAQSCQDCHMPSRDADGRPFRSKIASIQEYSNFPASDHALGPEDIDLPVRDGFAQHTLVGLNVFLVKIAQQFPDVLGIATRDPMLGSLGEAPLVRTEQAMLDLASNGTAALAVEEVDLDATRLRAKITVTNKTGHKFPSGVGFRRAFVTFRVLDRNGAELWVSGGTNAAGALVDGAGEPIDGEYWWPADCSARIDPLARRHQPHYETVTRQDQAQIFQTLISSPPGDGAPAVCGHGATPEGALTTSFLSGCVPVKDNRLLPKGYLPLAERADIAEALGASADLAAAGGSVAVGSDPDYVAGGGDSYVYEIPLADLPPGSSPASVEATLYYQATPPFYLQDRFCTSQSADTRRLKFLAGHLNLDGTEAEGWKLKVVGTGPVSIAED
jgi:hypothetical protein